MKLSILASLLGLLVALANLSTGVSAAAVESDTNKQDHRNLRSDNPQDYSPTDKSRRSVEWNESIIEFGGGNYQDAPAEGRKDSDDKSKGCKSSKGNDSDCSTSTSTSTEPPTSDPPTTEEPVAEECLPCFLPSNETDFKARVQEAIGASSTDYIMLCPGTKVNFSSEIRIEKGQEVNIGCQNSAGGTCEFNGGDSTRFFEVSTSGTLRLQGIIMKNGFVVGTENGGAIKNCVTCILEVDGCLFEDNLSSNNGGAIYSNGIFRSTNTNFIGNKGSRGAAIWVDGFGSAPKLKGGLFKSNTASTGNNIFVNSPSSSIICSTTPPPVFCGTDNGVFLGGAGGGFDPTRAINCPENGTTTDDCSP